MLWKMPFSTTTAKRLTQNVKNRFFPQNVARLQCDQIGRFVKVLGNKFAHKSSWKKIGDFWAILKNINLCKNCCVNDLGNFGKYLGNFFIQHQVTLRPPDLSHDVARLCQKSSFERSNHHKELLRSNRICTSLQSKMASKNSHERAFSFYLYCQQGKVI